MRIAVAGGAGFIGSNFVRLLMGEHPKDSVLVVDKLTYAGNLRNLDDFRDDRRFSFVQMDICDPQIADVIRGCDAVVNFAAESHVDRSIENAAEFVRTNVEGTYRLLEACRHAGIGRFLQISTDEVYGSLGAEGKFSEATPLAPNSPYAATKASADLLVLAYVHTYRTPALITRCSNNYGPYQFPEKFIPLMIAQAMAGEPLPVYGDGKNVRDWIHVEDHCRALDTVLRRGRDGEIYNIGGECEMENIEVAHRILAALGKSRDLVRYVTDRPGHDRRYAIDCSKLKGEMGWQPRCQFDDGLAQTIAWYRTNRPWLDEVRSGAYREYFSRHYERREELISNLKRGAGTTAG
jgi:dTDP-glucose 4,6-dehydratase